MVHARSPVKFALKCSPGQKIERRSEKVAIIGAGPAGLGAAGYLICRVFRLMFMTSCRSLVD